MAQLRQDYAEFVKRGAEILALGPDGPAAYQRFWQQENIPYIGLSDIGSKTADLYYQEVNLLKLGRMPAMFIVDLQGRIRYSHYGRSMADIPDNQEVLQELERIRAEDGTG